jgi:hypothetical protein
LYPKAEFFLYTAQDGLYGPGGSIDHAGRNARGGFPAEDIPGFGKG